MVSAMKAPPPAPLSPEWLHALERINPMQATVGRMNVQQAGGRIEICCVCGDDERLKLYQNDEQVGTPLENVRLCDTCCGAQRGMGAKLTSLQV
jgi:hypothetical protein